MTVALKASIASAALSIAAVLAPVQAADLHGGRGGSIKDNYVAPMPEVHRGPAGPCYFRADLGYSWSQDPSVKWPVTNGSWADPDGVPGNGDEYPVYNFIGDGVTGVSMENSWLGEVGVGCGSGSRGIRAELMLGMRGDRKIDGEPLPFQPLPPQPTDPNPPVQDDPLHTSLRSYTLMLNAYKDLGNYRGITPYVGAGVGVAYHMVDDVYFTGNPNLTNQIHGDRDISFAWSLMAGIGYQISDRAILDLGYRFIDMGKANSERSDSGGYVNPRVMIDDLQAHEIKIGLRYHFGTHCCAQPAYVPMK